MKVEYAQSLSYIYSFMVNKALQIPSVQQGWTCLSIGTAYFVDWNVLHIVREKEFRKKWRVGYQGIRDEQVLMVCKMIYFLMSSRTRHVDDNISILNLCCCCYLAWIKGIPRGK